MRCHLLPLKGLTWTQENLSSRGGLCPEFGEKDLGPNPVSEQLVNLSVLTDNKHQGFGANVKKTDLSMRP